MFVCLFEYRVSHSSLFISLQATHQQQRPICMFLCNDNFPQIAPTTIRSVDTVEKDENVLEKLQLVMLSVWSGVEDDGLNWERRFCCVPFPATSLTSVIYI